MPKIILFFVLSWLSVPAFAQEDPNVWAGGGEYEPGQAITDLLKSVGGDKRVVIQINHKGEVTGTLEAIYDRSKATIANDAVDITFLLRGTYDSVKNILQLIVTHIKAPNSGDANRELRSKDTLYYNTTILRQRGKIEMLGKIDMQLNKITGAEWVTFSRAASMGLPISNALNLHILPLHIRLEKFMPFAETTTILSPATPAERPEPKPAVETRKTEIQHTITLDTTLVKLDMYDNGEIDGDIATLILDGNVIINSQALSTKAISVTLQISRDKPEHLLELYANNLGSIPPNTALLVLTCNRKRYEINLSSNNASNGTVRLVFAVK